MENERTLEPSDEILKNNYHDESSRTLSVLLQNLPGVAYRCKNDKDWTMLFLSDGILPLTGYTSNELINNKKLAYNDIIAPEFRDYVLKVTNKGIKNKEHYKLEYQIICKSGEKKWVGEQGFGIRGKDGEILFIEGYIQDISDKKLLEVELKERKILQDKINMFVNGAPGGLFTLVQDKEGNFLIPFVNAGWEDIHGIKTEEIQNDLTKLKNYIYEKDLEQFLNSIEESSQKLTPFISTYKYKHPIKGDRWHSVSSIPIKDEYGNVYWNGFVTDITNEKEAELALIKSEERFRNALKNIPDVITIYDKDLKIRYLNDATYQITGMSASDFIGKREEEIWPSEVYAPYMPSLIKARDTKKPQEITTELRIPGKPTQYLNINCVPILNSKGELQEIMGITQNFTERKVKEQAIFALEMRFRETLENIKLIAVLLDTNGNITFCNEHLINITGYSKKEIFGKNWFEIFIDKEEIEVINHFKETLKTGELKPHYENKIITKQGKSLLIRFNNTILRDSEGNIVGITSIGEDITESKNAEIALRQSEEKFSKAFEASPDIIIITEFPSGKIIEANSSFQKNIGYSEEEYIGKSTLELNIWADLTEREIYFNTMKKYMKVEKMDVKIRIKSGEVRNFLLSSELIVLNGEECILAIAHDFTELKQSQQKIENEKLRLRTLIETIPDLIWVKDPSGIYLNCNHEFELFFGAKEEEIVGKTDYDFLPKAEADFFRGKDMEAIKANKPTTNFEKIEYASDGREVLLETIKTPMYDTEGKIIGVLGISRDITELQKFNENLENMVAERTHQLEIVNKDLEAFAYSISHDLRAPLRHINGYTRLLKESIVEGSEETERYYNKINESSIKMAAMIDDLLKFSRLGRKTLQKTDIDLNELIKQIIVHFEHETRNRKIEWYIGKLPIIKGDKNLIQLVFENLISNSIKFTIPKEIAKIEIDKCKKNNAICTIYIKDNGVGFDMAYVDKLFKVFQRLHTQDEFEGTGIGLANIKQIITKHGGKVWAEGEINKGATFYISL